MKKKSFALLTALVLVAGCVIGGTLAWLTDTTAPVKNTFTTSDIDIALTETPEEYKMVPGWPIHKDPKVTVEKGSEACYLFVKLEKSPNFDNFMTFEVAEGWTPLTDVEGVYYRIVDESDEMGVSYSVLKDDQVQVLGTVTKEKMNDLTEETLPTLTVTAYASQLFENNAEQFGPMEAWNNVQPAGGSN